MTDPFVKVFEIWEGEFREHPERFMTADQAAAVAVLPLAEQCAAYFEAILNTLPVVSGATDCVERLMKALVSPDFAKALTDVTVKR